MCLCLLMIENDEKSDHLLARQFINYFKISRFANKFYVQKQITNDYINVHLQIKGKQIYGSTSRVLCCICLAHAQSE